MKKQEKEDNRKVDAGPEAVHSALHQRSTQIDIPLSRFKVLCFSICLGLFLAMIDTSIVATSLYSIGTDFKDMANVNWVALAYTLAYMGCAVVFPRISDVTGRRNAYAVASMLFIAFSLACGFSQSLPQLIAFRAMQGIGGSGVYSLSVIMVVELSPKRVQQYITAVVGGVVAMSGSLGPVIGGSFTNYVTWRWAFWINGPVGGAALAMFLLSWPKPQYLPPMKKRSWMDLDYLGSILTIAAAVLVVFSFQNAGGSSSSSQSNHWTSAAFIAPLIIGIFCWIGLILWQYAIEKYFSNRIMAAWPLKIFRNIIYTLGVTNTLLIGFPYLLIVYVVPLRIQIVGGKSALLAGVMLLPMLISSACGSVISGAFNSRKPAITETLLAGSCLMLLGCGLLTTLSTHELDEAKLLGYITFCGLGFGLTVSSSGMIAATEVPREDYAASQGILAQVRIFGGSLGIAASTAILNSKMESAKVHLATRDAQSQVQQDAVIKLMYSESFKTDLTVATAMAGAAVLNTSIGYWRQRRRDGLPTKPEKVNPVTRDLTLVNSIT